MPLLRRAAAYEAGMWRSLYLWVRRRPVVPAGGEPFSYTGPVAPLFGVFIGLSAVEIPILHLLLPWQTVRYIALAVGAYGLLWMFGLLASLKVHPHVVAGSGLHVRNGVSVDITIPWDAIASVRARDRSLPPGRSIQIDESPTGLIMHLKIGQQTNVDVALREPMRLPLSRGDSEPISELRFAVDNPKALVASAREHLPVRQP